MNNSDCQIMGTRVAICLLSFSNIDDYLNIFKRASSYSYLYFNNTDLWNTAKADVWASLEDINDSINRYMILSKEKAVAMGYINLTYNDEFRPEVDIAIARDYQKRGYGFEAAKTLIDYILERQNIEAVIWTAFRSNIASQRIAEKLGGTLIGERDVIREAMKNAGWSLDTLKGNEKVPLADCYEIRKVSR